jgi:tetratricopeptide (TPR) repeat protein
VPIGALYLILFTGLVLISACGQSPKPVTPDAAESILPVADSAELPVVIRSLVQQSDREYFSNNLAASLATLERAIRINPRYPEVWSRMAMVLAQQGSLEQAMQYAKRSNNVLKNNPQLNSFNQKIIDMYLQEHKN